MAELGELELPPLFHGRYNIAPSQKIAVIRQSDPSRIEECIWGFKNPRSASIVINARSETLLERPMFKDLVANNRCLIPADGFYEWKGKQPYYFQTMKKQLFWICRTLEKWPLRNHHPRRRLQYARHS